MITRAGTEPAPLATGGGNQVKINKKIILFLQGFLALHILWLLASLLLHTRVVPSPVAVYAHFGLFIEDNLLLHTLLSLFRVACGLVIALVAGFLAGYLMARSERWNRLLNPLVYLTYPVPKTALLPVVMLLFGLGDPSKITVIALIVVFQVIVVVRGAVMNIPAETYNYVKSLGATASQAFRHVTLPAILPELLTNTKVSIGTALSILFFTEGYGTHWGLGYYILDAWTRIDYPAMYLGILVIGLTGFGLFLGMDVLEERLCRWKHRG